MLVSGINWQGGCVGIVVSHGKEVSVGIVGKEVALVSGINYTR